MRFSKDWIQQVDQAADLVQLISERGIDLRQQGDVFKGLCPFHPEKTPSFTVNPQRQFFYCFGCHASGGAIRFLTLHEKLSFSAATLELAQRYHVPLETPLGVGPTEEIPQLVCLQQAAQFYERFLQESPQGAAGRQYLQGRQVIPSCWKTFQLGFAPNDWSHLLRYMKSQSVPEKILIEVGLIRSASSGRMYDFFRNRLLFPIRDLRGRCVAFGGRALDGEQQPKYLNSAESEFYHKNKILYGFYEGMISIKKKRQVIIVEGYFDVIRLHEYGFDEAVAPCGTALTENHMKQIQRHVDRIFLVFDGDAAGKKAAFKSCPLFLNLPLEGFVISLPKGEDPDTLLKKEGPAGFRLCMDRAVPALEFFIQETLSQFPSSSTGILKAVDQLLPTINQISRLELRQLSLLQISKKTRLPEKTIFEMSEALISQKNRATVPGLNRVDFPQEDLHERRVLQIALTFRQSLVFLREHVAKNEFQVPRYQQIYQSLLEISDEDFAVVSIEKLGQLLPHDSPQLMEIYLEGFPLEHSDKQLRTSVYQLKLRNLKQEYQRKIVQATDESILQGGRDLRYQQLQLQQQLQL